MDGSAGSSELNPLLPQQVTLGMSATEDQEAMAADEDSEPGAPPTPESSNGSTGSQGTRRGGKSEAEGLPSQALPGPRNFKARALTILINFMNF